MNLLSFAKKEPVAPEQKRFGRLEFRQLIASRSVFFEKGLEYLATLLPKTDLGLHMWLQRAIQDNDALMFVHTISAAAIAGRRVPACVLPGGAALMRNEDEFGNIAWHCDGDVTAALLEAARSGALRPEREAIALFCAAACWQKHREGTAYPPEIAARGRELARKSKGKLELMADIGALAVLIGSEEMQRMAGFCRLAHLRQPQISLKNAMIGMLETDFRNVIPDGPVRGINSSVPMRSSMPDVERNDPCHCGSGKKYKKCCHDKDRARWRESSDVAGLTTTELSEDLGEHLSKARIARMEAHELARLEPEKLPADLVSAYLAGLGKFKRYPELIKAFTKLGVTGAREADWIAAFQCR